MNTTSTRDNGLPGLQHQVFLAEGNDEHKLISKYAQQLKHFNKASNPLHEKQKLATQLEAKNREMQREIMRLQHQQQHQQHLLDDVHQRKEDDDDGVDEELLQQIRMLRQHQGELERRMKGLQGSRNGLMQQLEELMKKLNTPKGMDPCSPHAFSNDKLSLHPDFPFFAQGFINDDPSLPMSSEKQAFLMQQMIKTTNNSPIPLPPIAFMPPLHSKLPPAHILRQLQQQHQYATMPINLQLQNDNRSSFAHSQQPQPQTLPSKLINQGAFCNLNPMNYSYGSHFHQAFAQDASKPNSYNSVLHSDLLTATDDLANVMTSLVDEMNMELDRKVAELESKEEPLDAYDVHKETHLFIPDPSPYFEASNYSSSHDSPETTQSSKSSQEPPRMERSNYQKEERKMFAINSDGGNNCKKEKSNSSVADDNNECHLNNSNYDIL